LKTYFLYLDIPVGRLVEPGELSAEYIDIEIVAHVVGEDELGEADLPGDAGPPHHQVALAALLNYESHAIKLRITLTNKRKPTLYSSKLSKTLSQFQATKNK